MICLLSASAVAILRPASARHYIVLAPSSY
jgi:hypothetical protein